MSDYKDDSVWLMQGDCLERMKQCKHCDVMFLRPDNTPIPDDACVRCHEEVEALKAYMESKKRPNKTLLWEKINKIVYIPLRWAYNRFIN